MSDEKYNGWSNYETRNVKMWIDNEEGSYQFWQETAKECLNCNEDKDAAVYDLTERLKGEIEDNQPSLNGTYGDLLSAAISEVDFWEIAKAMIDDLEEA